MPNNDEITTITPEIVADSVRNDLDKLKPSTVEVLKAMDRGMTAKEAVYLVKGKQSLSYEGEKQLKEKYRKWSLASPAMQKLAHRAVLDTLAMKPIITSDGKELHPSHTNRLAAAAMVADRVEPVVKVNQNLNINVDISPVDLDRYR